ncbi:MAG: hypothetical protein E4G77_04850 [Nitrosopumilus sp.]|nr:MAG: hypothetical protein E4G77_04850 [Nitrosopumilus sp.]HUU47599.1 hypothetical protein [Nitrosopumilaceae archaeon]
MSEKITPEDHERVTLLRLITNSRHEFNKLSVEQLTRLQELVEKKNYSHNKKAHKSKMKLLAKINVRLYELAEGRSII